MRSVLSRPRALAISVLVIAVAVGGGWWAAALRPDTRPPLTSALDVLPADTRSVGFTDWAQIRDHLDLGTVNTSQERAELTALGASRDLTTRSVINRNLDEMHDALGWSAANVAWESYAQGPAGEVVVVRLDSSLSFDRVRAGLRSSGYSADDNLWSVDRRPAGLPDLLDFVGLDARSRLVVMSDRPAQVAKALDVIDGSSRSLASVQAAAETAQALAGSDVVLLQAGTVGCAGTAVDPQDEEETSQAKAAIARAGKLAPYRFSGRATVDRGGSGFAAQEVVFAMTFGSAVTASHQEPTRARLATGPFIGRSGQIAETLRLTASSHDGSTVRLAFAHDPDTDVFMTGFGPILFATC